MNPWVFLLCSLVLLWDASALVGPARRRASRAVRALCAAGGDDMAIALYVSALAASGAVATVLALALR